MDEIRVQLLGWHFDYDEGYEARSLFLINGGMFFIGDLKSIWDFTGHTCYVNKDKTRNYLSGFMGDDELR